MGRKKLPPGRAREKPLRIRLNEEERRLADEAALVQGHRSTSAWVREELLAGHFKGNIMGIQLWRANMKTAAWHKGMDVTEFSV